MSLGDILNFCKSVFGGLYDVATRVIDIATTPIGQLVGNGNFPAWVNDAIEYWLSKFGLTNVTLIAFMLGSGLIAFIGYTLIKWLVSLVP